MPRDISGNYTLPAGNPVVTATTISSTWANATLSDIASALTASLSIDGSVTNAKLATNAVSNAKIQDDAVTPPKLDGLSGSGLVVADGSTFVAARTLTGPAAGITVTNGTGVAGNPTLALDDDLAALEAQTGTGLMVRSGADTYAHRTITGTANKVTVSNGDGVAGNPTLTLPDAITLVTPTISGNATVGGTLGVTGATTLTGGVTGNVVATGNVAAGGYLEGDYVRDSAGAKLTLTAWVAINMVTPAVIDSYNVTSVTDNATGDFTINFTNALANANYCWTACSRAPVSTSQLQWAAAADIKTTSALQVRNTNSGTGQADSPEYNVMVIGG